MSDSKRMLEEQEGKRSVAMSIALESNVLEECGRHPECIYSGSEEIANAYKLGNHKLSFGKLNGVFKDSQEMTFMINEVVNDHQADECLACAQIRDE